MVDNRSRVVSALNHLTGEGISYYPDGCDHGAMEAIIQDYFDDGVMKSMMTSALLMKVSQTF